jgi:hypothetical protein
MPFITTPERVGRRDGMREGISALLEMRFGADGLKLMPEIEEVHEEEKLVAIMQAIKTIESSEDLRRIWSPQTS